MNKTEIIARLTGLALPKSEYWVIAGSAMALYGLREQTNDIDLGCTTLLADALQRQGYPVTVLDGGSRRIAIGDDIEVYENWLYDQVILWESIPVISPEGLLQMKQFLGRPKDQDDIARIEAFLKTSCN